MVIKLPEDGGSFDRLLRVADEEANGDESKKLTLLTKMIVEDLVQMLGNKEPATSLERKRKRKRKANNVDHLGFCITRRKRGTVPEELPTKMGSLVLKINKEKISLKRCFDQIQNCGNEQEQVNYIRNPKKLKIEKKGRNKRDLHDQEESEIPDMPEAFKLRIQEENGTDIMLVMQKRLEASDLDSGKNRLSIPKTKVRDEQFISQEEKDFVAQNPRQGMKVLVVPPSLKGNITLILKRWKMNGNYIFNLIDKWHSGIVDDKDNELKLGSKVQLWRFRKHDGDLCFALVRVEG